MFKETMASPALKMKIEYWAILFINSIVSNAALMISSRQDLGSTFTEMLP